jgi:predicted DCC family thiol-disulfide oxidoreductase YuxK
MGTVIEIGDKSLLLFDGVCDLCNGAVNFVIERDLNNHFVFASLQSEVGQQIAHKYNLPKGDFNSMVLLKNGKIFLRSNAALEVTKGLTGSWQLLYGFKIIPRFIRDWVYNIVSENRYKWFGRQDQCRMPSVKNQSRFISI